MRAICQRRATGGVQARQRVTDHSQAAEREALLEPTRSRRRRYDRRPNARPYSTTGHISTLIVLLTFRAVSAAGPVPPLIWPSGGYAANGLAGEAASLRTRSVSTTLSH